MHWSLTFLTVTISVLFFFITAQKDKMKHFMYPLCHCSVLMNVLLLKKYSKSTTGVHLLI